MSLSDEVAHDLKNPLQVIAGYAELLLVRDDSELREEAAKRILEATALLRELIERLVDGRDGRV